jgi:hypothetical protein
MPGARDLLVRTKRTTWHLLGAVARPAVVLGLIAGFGTNVSRGPALPVTGPHFPLGPLGVLGLCLLGAGMVIVRRARTRGDRS